MDFISVRFFYDIDSDILQHCLHHSWTIKALWNWILLKAKTVFSKKYVMFQMAFHNELQIISLFYSYASVNE